MSLSDSIKTFKTTPGKRRYLLATGLLTGAIAVIVLSGVLFNLGPPSRYAGARFARYASERLGKNVACHALQIHFSHIELVDLSIQGDDTEGEPARLSFKRLALYPHLFSLFSGKPQLRRVKGEHFTLRLPLDQIAAKPQDAQTKESTPLVGGLRDFFSPAGFDTLLRDGRLVLPGDADGKEAGLVLPRIQVKWPNPPSGPASLAMEIAGADDATMQITLKTRPGGTDLSLEASGNNFALEPFRSSLSRLLPPRARTHTTPVLKHLTQLPTLSGNLNVGYDRVRRTLEANGSVNVSSMYIQDERLAPEPVGPFTLEQDFTLYLDMAQTELEVQHWEGSVNDAKYRLEGKVRGLPEALMASLEMRLNKLPYQDIIDAVPATMISELEGIRLGGSLDLDLHFEGDLRATETWTSQLAADWSRLWLEQPSKVLRGTNPLDGTTYLPESSVGIVRRIVLGRGTVGWEPIEEVPPHLIHALLVSEDINFFRHEGFDFEGLKEAIRDDLKAGRAVRGGSTITQQLAKNLFLSRERTLSRKLQEAGLAWQLERLIKKKDILEYYINIIEWGPGIYGIEAAARHYFDKPPSELSVREAAYLCTIIPSPIRYHIYYKRGRLSPRWKQNVNELLAKMRQFEYLSEEEYQRALFEEIRFAPSPEEVPEALENSSDEDPEEPSYWRPRVQGPDP